MNAQRALGVVPEVLESVRAESKLAVDGEASALAVSKRLIRAEDADQHSGQVTCTE